MRIQIQKWGNSLALRIPKAFAKEIRIENNSLVDLNLENNRLVISPIRESENYDLSTMLSEINKENLHEVIDFGGAVGEELL